MARKRNWRQIAYDNEVKSSTTSATNVKLDPKMSKKSLKLAFKNVVNDPHIKKIIKVGGDVASAIAPFSEKPTVWNGIKAAFMAGRALADNFEIWSHDFFDEEGQWMEPFPRDFTGAIVKVLKKFPYEVMKTATEGNDIHLITLPEGRVGWVVNTKFSWRVDRIYAETDNIIAVRDKIKQLLWEQYDGKPLVLRRNQVTMRSLEEDRIVLEVDDTFKPMTSAIADEYVSYLKRALDAGVFRSVMLYGPPGTGKSTAARTIITNLNLRSFRIRIEDIGSMENNTLFEAIDIFKPEAIILDDFDRAHNQEHLLETLEHFKRHTKLVIATVNHRSSLDEALLRPGRFDELILVKKMDDEVIRAVLGDENMGQYEKMKDWPIAFIQEFIIRRRFMSEEEASKSISELAARVERLSDYDEDDSWAKVRGVKRQTKNPGDPDDVPRQRIQLRSSTMKLRKTPSDLLTVRMARERQGEEDPAGLPLVPELLTE